MCAHVCVLEVGSNNEAEDPGEGERHNGRWGLELWPSQGHCTEVLFIDRSTAEGTHAVACTVGKVNSKLTVIVTVFLFVCVL